MNRTRFIMAGALALVMSLLITPAQAQSTLPDAAYSRSAMSPAEKNDFPYALGKVTKAGLVAGKIKASVGDFVLGPCDQVPDNYGGEAPTCDSTGAMTMSTASTTAATTVLHASETLTKGAGAGPSPTTSATVRSQTAIEENTNGEVRFYYRQRLVYGSDITWTTYHGGGSGTFTIFRGDYGTNQADNCTTFYSGHCSASRLSSDSCRGGTGGPCAVYVDVGSYRNKGDAADKWVMEAFEVNVWNPSENLWKSSPRTCGSSGKNTGLLWTVSGSPAPYRPSQCPVPYGRTFA